MNAGHEYEEVESIPWSSLVAQAKPRPLLAYVAGAVLVALALGLLAGRTVLRRTAAAPVAAELQADGSAITTTTLIVAQETEATPASASISHPALAEWFVTDFFTDDGDERRADDLERLLGSGAPVPLVPTATYVEWARAWSVRPVTGATEVTVVFRTITATSDGFARDPVRAVAVPIGSFSDGTPYLAGLPGPAEVPSVPPDIPSYSTAVPVDVGAAAIAAAGDWGVAAVPEGANVEGGRWAVLTRVTDARGNSWPFVVEVDADESGLR